MLSAFLLLTLVWAQSPDSAPGDPPPQAPVGVTATPQAGEVEPVVPLTPEQRWAQMVPEDVLSEVVARRRVGDYAGAAERLDFLKSRQLLLAQVSYHWGILAEVQEDYRQAVERYALVQTQYPDAPVAADAKFRQAYCLEDLGAHKAALELVKQLKSSGKWSASDAHTLSLQQGIVELRSGKRSKGIKRIVAELEAVAPSEDQSWIRSKARIALVRAQLQAAADINLRSRWFTVRRLKKRARLMAAAEEQAKAAFRLGEPEFALEGLMLLGDAYVQLYEDMLTTPVPWRTKAADRPEYQAKVKKKSAILLVKAHARYDEGVRVAARTQWQGQLTQTLTAKRDALVPQSD